MGSVTDTITTLVVITVIVIGLTLLLDDPLVVSKLLETIGLAAVVVVGLRWLANRKNKNV